MGEAATTQGLRHIASQEAPVWVMAAGRCFHLVSIRRQQMRDMPPRATACCCCLTCVGIGRHLPDCAKPATAGVFQLGAMLWSAAKLCGQSFPQAQCLRRLAPCPSRKPCISPAWRGQVLSRLARAERESRTNKPFPFFMGEGLGWGLNKTAQRQRPAFTSLAGPVFSRLVPDRKAYFCALKI